MADFYVQTCDSADSAIARTHMCNGGTTGADCCCHQTLSSVWLIGCFNDTSPENCDKSLAAISNLIVAIRSHNSASMRSFMRKLLKNTPTLCIHTLATSPVQPCNLSACPTLLHLLSQVEKEHTNQQLLTRHRCRNMVWIDMVTG